MLLSLQHLVQRGLHRTSRAVFLRCLLRSSVFGSRFVRRASRRTTRRTDLGFCSDSYFDIEVRLEAMAQPNVRAPALFTIRLARNAHACTPSSRIFFCAIWVRISTNLSSRMIMITHILFCALQKYEHSEQALAPHTNGPRDVPRCGALSLLQKTLKTRFNSNPNGTEANDASRSVRAWRGSQNLS